MPKTAPTRRPKAGPPSFPYNESAALAICRDVEEGVPLPEAYLCHGLPAAAGAAWKTEHPDFAHELEVAHARHVRSLIREVREAVAGSGARHDWRASLVLLERADQVRAAHATGPDKANPSAREIFTSAQLAALQARRRRALTTHNPPPTTPAELLH